MYESKTNCHRTKCAQKHITGMPQCEEPDPHYTFICFHFVRSCPVALCPNTVLLYVVYCKLYTE